MRRWIILAVAGLLLLCSAGTALLIVRSQGASGIHSVHVYPGASNVQVTDFGQSSNGQVVWAGKGLGLQTISHSGGVMIFTTTDTPQQVASYYDNILKTAGWKPMGSGSGLSSGGSTASNTHAVSTLNSYIYNSPFIFPPFLRFLRKEPASVVVTADAIADSHVTYGDLTLFEP